jgi:parallel beta-helix repeat protein
MSEGVPLVPGQPVAFMSYIRFDDRHDDGQLTQFREQLSAEVRVQTGEPFPIFQDRNDIAWGQNWQHRIDQTLDTATLLLVIITPGFFRSPACRAEVERFLERERELGRQDLILPVYYVSTPELDDPRQRDADELARVLASRQFADWRELRFEPFTSPAVRKTLAQLATRMRDTFWRLPSEVPAPLNEPVQVTRSRTSTADVRVATRVIPKTEPPTYVVDPYQRRDFSTVAEAIEAAKPGDRILVRPGLYEESLVIRKPLEIIGDGPVEDIELRVRRDSVIVFRANIGRIANLTLRQIDGDAIAVNIFQGRLDLEDCDISSEGFTCVAICPGADPRLRRNRIHDGANEGILVYDDGRGTLEDNEIFGNADAGVIIATGGNPTLRRNRIHYNKTHGVTITDDSLGTFEDNEISANVYSGVIVQDGSNPVMRRNQIHNNKQNGVFVVDAGRGLFEDNDITENSLHGLSVKADGNPTLRRNNINRNFLEGVSIQGNGGGTYEDNDLTDNRLGAWSVDDSCEKSVIRVDNRE